MPWACTPSPPTSRPNTHLRPDRDRLGGEAAVGETHHGSAARLQAAVHLLENLEPRHIGARMCGAKPQNKLCPGQQRIPSCGACALRRGPYEGEWLKSGIQGPSPDPSGEGLGEVPLIPPPTPWGRDWGRSP
eukprot:365613-Chlamydomonas_euryale.AAC.5